MSAGWVAYALVTGTLVAVACVALEGLCRQHRMPTRWSWAAGLAALAAFSLRAVAVAREGDGGLLQLVATGPTSGAVAPGGRQRGIAVVAARLLHASDAALAWLAQQLPTRGGQSAVVLWVALSALALLAFVVVHLRLTRARHGWPRAELHGHDVRIAPALGPAVLGLVQPVIVVPRWLLARGAEEQQLVLAHEREHVRARDHLLLAGAWIAVAVVPWHPAAWWMLARLRLAIELDCDARVLRRGVAPRAYGALLIDLAGQCSGFTVGATALADEASHLERRLLAMTPTPFRHQHLRAGTLAVTGLLALLAACEAKIPTQAEVNNMDAASAEKSAVSMNLLGDDAHGANTVYFVDGVKSDAATVHAIAPNRIATVEVRKENGAGEVRITTLATPRPANADGSSGPIEMHIRHLVGDSVHSTGAFSMTRDSAVVIVDDRGNAHGALHQKMDLGGNFSGLVLIDGVRADMKALHAIDPRSIVSVEVVKGPKATELSSDPAAANGIIKVTTKAKQ